MTAEWNVVFVEVNHSYMCVGLISPEALLSKEYKGFVLTRALLIVNWEPRHCIHYFSRNTDM